MSPGHKNEKRSQNGRGQAQSTDGKPLFSGVSNVAQLQQAADELAHAIQAGSLNSSDYFEAELKQKDELITALIQELEQAVDRLDRVERMGTDRSHVNMTLASAPGLRELSGARPNLSDSLQRMAEDWDQSQPHAQIEKIGSQLSEMYELLINLNRPNSFRGPFEAFNDQRQPDFTPPGAIQSEADTDPCGMTLEESSATWETIKHQLLEMESSPTPVAASSIASEEDKELLRFMSETPAPTNVDFNLASSEMLQSAIVERDAYIIQLNRMIRTRNNYTIPKDWAALANAPAELQAQVDSLIKHLDAQVRMGEVEMSLERARLARERSQLQTDREEIEKHLRRLDLKSISELDNISTTSSSSTDRRFMRFIGPKLK